MENVLPRLYRFCYYLTGTPALATHLSHDVATSANGNHDLKWIYKIARQRFLDQMRRRELHHQNQESKFDSKWAWLSNGADLNIHVLGMLQKLAPEDRYLLVLVHMEGHSAREAAQICGLKESIVKARLHKIKKEFKSVFFSQRFKL